jgi:hypothetical protein
MAIPRVFISSTFYDLQHVRNDLEGFLKGLDYEPVMHDKGKVAYGQGDETLEESCYSELSTCDIVICIIGSKFGSKSSNSDYSITMKELLSAVKGNKIIYVFIQNDVFIENNTYIKNKDTDSFISAIVDDNKVHEFIYEIKSNIKNHPIHSFNAVTDIITFLKQQFAGLFQKLLSQQATQTDSKTFYDIKEIADTIRLLTNNFIEEKDDFFRKFEGTIYSTNMVIRNISKKLGLSKSNFFAKNFEALEEFLFAMGFHKNGFSSDTNVYEYCRCIDRNKYTLKINGNIFNEQNNINDIRAHNLIDELVVFEQTDIDDQLPF